MKQAGRLIVLCGFVCAVLRPTLGQAQELNAATVVNKIMQSTTTIYQSMVVDKLQREGTGASAAYTSQEGFVPLPVTFMRRVAINTISRQMRAGQRPYTFTTMADGTGYLRVKMTAPTLSTEAQALLVAQVLDDMVRSIRGVYTTAVLRKLKRDGTGASADYTSQKGFIPLPAVFLRLITADAVKQTNNQFSVALRSLWNLNPQQGLQDDFERTGWASLANQQEQHLAVGDSMQKFLWKPYVQTVKVGSKRTLRYLSADPAAGRSCVTCHNAWEARQEIKKQRAQQDVEMGKTFAQHELMGALSITVPIDK